MTHLDDVGLRDDDFRVSAQNQYYQYNESNGMLLWVGPTNRMHVDIHRKLIEMMTQMENHCIYKVHLDTHVARSCAGCTQSSNLFQAIFFREGKKLCFHLSSHEIWKKQNYKWKKK